MGTHLPRAGSGQGRQEVSQETHLHGDPQLWGQRRIAAEDVLDASSRSTSRMPSRCGELFAAYAERKAALERLRLRRFAAEVVRLLDHPEAGPAIRRRFDCVLVDEYQDTNRLQARLLQGLCPDGRGLTVVGDDAQSIYSFRAATVRNILDFPQQFPGTQVVTLEQNYRSTQPILEATNRVIAAGPRAVHEGAVVLARRRRAAAADHLRGRARAGGVRGRPDPGPPQAGVPLSQQAVLFRASHHSILLESQLARHGLPFVKYGGLKFVEAAHVKDLLSLLRLAENPRDPVAGAAGAVPAAGHRPEEGRATAARLSAADGRFDVWREAKLPAKSKDAWPGVRRLDEFPGRRRLRGASCGLKSTAR